MNAVLDMPRTAPSPGSQERLLDSLGDIVGVDVVVNCADLRSSPPSLIRVLLQGLLIDRGASTVRFDLASERFCETVFDLAEVLGVASRVACGETREPAPAAHLLGADERRAVANRLTQRPDIAAAIAEDDAREASGRPPWPSDEAPMTPDELVADARRIDRARLHPACGLPGDPFDRY